MRSQPIGRRRLPTSKPNLTHWSLGCLLWLSSAITTSASLLHHCTIRWLLVSLCKHLSHQCYRILYGTSLYGENGLGLTVHWDSDDKLAHGAFPMPRSPQSVLGRLSSRACGTRATREKARGCHSTKSSQHYVRRGGATDPTTPGHSPVTCIGAHGAARIPITICSYTRHQPLELATPNMVTMTERVACINSFQTPHVVAVRSSGSERGVLQIHSTRKWGGSVEISTSQEGEMPAYR